MCFSKSFWTMLVAVALTLPGGPHLAWSEAQHKNKISLNVTSQMPLPAVELGHRKIVLRDSKGARTGLLIAKKGQRVLSFPGQADVQLPYDLPSIISPDGHVVLQYGDTQDLSHPRVTHLYWLDGQGREHGRLEGYFRAAALIGLSDDGFTVVAGSRNEKPHAHVLSLFNPSGQRVWERPLESERVILTEPKVAFRGERVAAITCNAENPLKDHRILILDKKNTEVKAIDTLGLIQKIVILGQSKALFVQGRDRHGLIDLTDGNIVWTRPGNVRLISPSGAALNPDGTLLFLLLADWSGRSKAAYPWRLKALDATDGRVLGMVAMPKPMAGTRSDLFGSIGMNQVEIITDTDQFTVSIGR